MRAGPDSPIDPAAQIAYHGHGLGSGLGRGRLRDGVGNFLSTAFGTNISATIINCYEAMIASLRLIVMPCASSRLSRAFSFSSERRSFASDTPKPPNFAF